MTDFEFARVGTFTVTALWDGDFPCDRSFMPAAGSREGKETFRSAGLASEGPIHEPVNAFAVERGGELWLVDGGVGTEVMPGFGRVERGLAELGRPAAGVGHVVLTHLHEDHVGGLMRDGVLVYPNARLFIPEAEMRFWTGAEARKRGPKADVDRAHALLELYTGHVEVVAGTEEFAPGLSFRPLYGHTPGHSGVMVCDGTEELLIWADLVHSSLLQMRYPEWHIIHDMDPALTARTRRAVLEELAGTGRRVMGSHVRGVGRVERSGSGFTFRHERTATIPGDVAPT